MRHGSSINPGATPGATPDATATLAARRARASRRRRAVTGLAVLVGLAWLSWAAFWGWLRDEVDRPREELRDEADPADVDVAILLGKAEAAGEVRADLVAEVEAFRSAMTAAGLGRKGYPAGLAYATGKVRVGEMIRASIPKTDALLLGRKTYDIFSGYWPNYDDDFAGGIAEVFNRIPKYVASHGTPELTWAGSSLIGPDIAASIAEIRDRHENTHVIGSVDFVQTLLAEKLFDRLNLLVYPITLGSGKKVFGSGTVPSNLRLAEPAYSTPSGTVVLHYELAEGIPATGTMG